MLVCGAGGGLCLGTCPEKHHPFSHQIVGALHPPEQKWEPHRWVPVTQRCLSPVSKLVLAVPDLTLVQVSGISPSFELWISDLCHGQLGLTVIIFIFIIFVIFIIIY